MTCERGHDAGSYVLGALSPAERIEFERHLGGCAECARSVQELAGLPGLLARIGPEVLESPPRDEPVPATLLPALVKEAHRSRRRRTWLTAGLSAAAALVVAGSVVTASAVLDGDAGPGTAEPAASAPATTAPSQPMVALSGDAVSGELALTGVAWGTRLDLTCTYEAGEDYGAGAYAMVVRTRDGHTEQVATWRGLPGKTMRLSAATATGRDDIASVEVRTAAGDPVLELSG